MNMRVNVWIRKENEQVWQDMANKSEWLNEMLVRETTPLPDMPRISKPKTEILKDIKSDFGVTPVEQADAWKFCKHDAVLGMCKKGCR